MLREWTSRRYPWIEVLTAAEAPESSRTCANCNSPSSDYRCMDCFGVPTLCGRCCLSSHQRSPFHRIKIWKDNHYGSSNLDDLGLVMHLGHHGKPCPTEHLREGEPSLPGEGIEEEWEDLHAPTAAILFVGVQGVVMRTVRWCCCEGAKPHDLQLLGVRLMPATSKQIRTAFTFEVLQDFHMSRLECNTSAMTYFQKIRRMTDNAFQLDVAVCSKGFY